MRSIYTVLETLKKSTYCLCDDKFDIVTGGVSLLQSDNNVLALSVMSI